MNDDVSMRSGIKRDTNTSRTTRHLCWYEVLIDDKVVWSKEVPVDRAWPLRNAAAREQELIAQKLAESTDGPWSEASRRGLVPGCRAQHAAYRARARHDLGNKREGE